MTAFGTELKHYLTKNRIKSFQFAALVGISKSTLSRYLGDDNPALPEPDQLERVLDNIADGDSKKNVLLAYVRDRLPSTLRPMIYVDPHLYRPGEKPAKGAYAAIHLSDEDRKVIDYWARECARDAKTGEFLRSIASLRERK